MFRMLEKERKWEIFLKRLKKSIKEKKKLTFKKSMINESCSINNSKIAMYLGIFIGVFIEYTPLFFRLNN